MGTDVLLKHALLQAFRGRFRFHNNRFQECGETAVPPESGRDLPDKAWRVLGRQVMALHEAYTGSGGEFSHDQNPIHRHQAGYQFYYLPRNVFRIQHVLQSLPWQEGNGLAQIVGPAGSAGEDGSLKVLDLGCGTGAFSLALLSQLGEFRDKAPQSLRIVLVDQGRSLLHLAEANIRALAALALPGSALHLELRPEGVEAYLASESRRGFFDIVGGGMMLNEMALLAPRRGSRRAVRFVSPLMRLPRKGGLILFVEPGTRKGYMNLMALREQIEGLPILFPCPHARPCPMWGPKVSRWCHVTRPLPDDFAFDADLRRKGGLGFAMREINLAGLAFQHSVTGRLQYPFKKLRGNRVVSGFLPGKRGKAKRNSDARTGRASSPDSVVLQCGEKGRLKEIPAASMGAYPRGLWMDAGSGRKTGKN